MKVQDFASLVPSFARIILTQLCQCPIKDSERHPLQLLPYVLGVHCIWLQVASACSYSQPLPFTGSKGIRYQENAAIPRLNQRSLAMTESRPSECKVDKHNCTTNRAPYLKFKFGPADEMFGPYLGTGNVERKLKTPIPVLMQNTKVVLSNNFPRDWDHLDSCPRPG